MLGFTAGQVGHNPSVYNVGNHTQKHHVRNYIITERLKVENITKRCRKVKLRFFQQSKRQCQVYLGRDVRDGPGGYWDREAICRRLEVDVDIVMSYFHSMSTKYLKS